jgi:hypothetical protein
MIDSCHRELPHGSELRRSIQIAVPLLQGHENTTRHDGPQPGAHHQVRLRHVSEGVDLRGPAISAPNEHDGDDPDLEILEQPCQSHVISTPTERHQIGSGTRLLLLGWCARPKAVAR